MKALIIYYTITGHTRDAAEEIAAGMKENHVTAVIKSDQEVDPKEIQKYDLVLVGSPCHAGHGLMPV